LIFGQSYHFRHLTVKEGLTQNTITAILKDYRGFIWLGTYTGLNRYDGTKVKQFKNDVNDSTSLTNNAIKYIFEDSKKNLWIGCYNGGLLKFNRKKENFIRYPNTLDQHGFGNLENIMIIAEDSSGILWIGSEGGLCSFDPVQGKYLKHYYDFFDNPDYINTREVFTIYKDKQQKLWLGIRNKFGYFDFVKEKFITIANLPDFSNYRIVQDKNNKFWLGSLNNGVIEFEIGKGVINHYKDNSRGKIKLSGNGIESMFVDDNNNVWIGTKGNGIEIINNKSETVINLKNDEYDNKTLSNNYILTFFQDNTNILWIGTNYGLNILDYNRKKFNSIPFEKKIKSSSNDYLTTTIVKDNNKNYWFGTWASGILKYNFITDELTQLLHDPININTIPGNVIRYLYIDKKENLWICTNGSGLSILNLNTNQYSHFSEDNHNSFFPDNVCNYMIEDNKGIFWIGTWHGGLVKCKLDKKGEMGFKNYIPDKLNINSISHKTVTCILQDSEGTIWVATKGGGLNKIIGYDDTNEPVFKIYKNMPDDKTSISSDELISLYEDQNKNLWIGTNTAGLCKYIKETDSFKRYSLSNGFSSNIILGIQEDDNNNLWLSTSNGISKFNIVTEEIINYDYNDGIINNSFFENSSYKDDSGKIFFGGDVGVVYFHPDSIKSNNFIPQVEITGLDIFNSKVAIGETINNEVILEKSILETEEITLSYKESVITIEFAALHYSSPDKNQFAYKLEGFDENWRTTNSNRAFATYTNLDPGEYLFRVIASNNDGLWNETGDSLKITYIPPLWSTWWAYIIYTLLVLGIFIGYVKIRTSRQKKQLEILRKADKLKTEFLAQMSHEIRSPINIILSFTSLLKDELKGTKDEFIKDSFNSIDNAGKRIIRTIDLILNMSEVQSGTYDFNPKTINIKSDILEKLLKEYKPMADTKKINLQLLEEEILPDMKLDEYTVNQIFANLIDNSIKFTHEGGIIIKLDKSNNNKFFVSVKDTGIGIDKEYLSNLFEPFSQEEQGYTRRFEGNGLGLALVKKYCEYNNITLEVTSKKNIGTEIKVFFNY
jgi:signal transduction histidine kinase/ligand-binding sensor domain-containing protein